MPYRFHVLDCVGGVVHRDISGLGLQIASGGGVWRAVKRIYCSPRDDDSPMQKRKLTKKVKDS